MFSAAEYNNLVIPILGLCILVPVFAALCFDTEKSYSRKIYISLFASCVLLLIMENLQWLVDGCDLLSLKIRLQYIVNLIFYLTLVSLCYFWMKYSYFWFYGHPASGRLSVLSAFGPAAEAAALFLNLFTGRIYDFDSAGTYLRGPDFSLFIGFSYLYLMAVICFMAWGRKQARRQKYDIALFGLFFIFPILGPLFQYLLPSISIMGTTEAIALLTIYIVVQQRSSARYAVERARYQVQYREYEKTLETLLSASGDALCVFHLNITRNTFEDEHGRSVYIRTLIRQNTVDELFGTISSIIADPEESAQFKGTFNRTSLLEDIRKQKMQISLGYHRRVENGELHWIRTYLHMLSNPGSGDVEGIVYSVDMDRQEKEEKVITAITNREYDYIALINTESRKIHYQYTAEKAVSSVYLKMGDYNTVMAEAAAALQQSEQQGYYQKIAYETVMDALQKHGEYTFIYDYRTAGGEVLQKKITYQFLDPTKQEIVFFRNDITEETRLARARTEQLQVALAEAQHANAMKSEFLSNVSHDMRTPLNAVLGYTALVRKAGNAEEAKTYLDKLERAGRILLSLINDTLDLSKIETGLITLKPETVRFDEFVNKVVTSIRPAMDEKHINFILDRSRCSVNTVSADVLRMQEIFLNLLSNTVKFTPEGGTVALITESEESSGRTVRERITVRDTGCGISAGFLPKLYEPFSQERQAANAGVGGSGLGLSIVKKLVDLMHGTIAVHSELGRGTEFIVTLDLEKADEIPEKDQNHAENWNILRGCHVLLAEDNAMNTEIAKAMLEAQGMTVDCVGNGMEACRVFAESAVGEYTVILMDIRMPEMNGHEAARQIWALKRPDAAEIPIIAMSADAFDDDIKESFEAGMDGHIAKPVDPARLYDLLSGKIRRVRETHISAKTE